MGRKRNRVKEEAAESESENKRQRESKENVPPRRSRRAKTQINYTDADPKEEDNHEDFEDEIAQPVRPRSTTGGRAGQYSKAHTVMVRHPKSVSKAEGSVVSVKFNDGLPVDVECPLRESHRVLKDTAGKFYNAMLNQTNIANNNNKYYILQILEARATDEGFAVWFRWGRVGRIAGTMLKKYPKSAQGREDALNDFCKKFWDKTRNEWAERHDFGKVAGKYDLVEQDFGEDLKTEVKQEEIEVKSEPCELDPEIQALIEMICDVSRMENYAKEMKFDIERAPLGKLTEKQISHGFEILKQIEAILIKKGRSKLANLSSAFYTRIPHDFGMRRPPVIDELEQVVQGTCTCSVRVRIFLKLIGRDVALWRQNIALCI